MTLYEPIKKSVNALTCYMVWVRILILFLLTSYSLQAQDRCSIIEYEKLKGSYNREKARDFEKWIGEKININRLKKSDRSERTSETTYTIPVVFHIVHKGEPVGTGVNISDAQILSQIKVLNNDFNRLNSDASSTPAEFQGVAGNIAIEFVLAKQDPTGNATNGIVRVRGSQNTWSLAEDAQLKSQSYWPAENYLNIWVADMSGGLVGYAQFPQSNLLSGLEEASDNRLTDGVILDYVAVGSISDGSFVLDSRYNRGRTATHEIGHFFGLRHIWGDDQNAANNCSATDYVADTPNQSVSSNGCPTHPRTTCAEVSMFQNYLDYTNDVCMNLFTKGQVERMLVILENSPRRASLTTSPGARTPDGNNVVVDLAITGYNSPSPVSCKNFATPVVTIKNKGTATIFNFDINVRVNTGAPSTKTISSTGILPNAELTLTLDPVTLASGSNELSVEITQPNNVTDANVSDNSLTIQSVANNATDIIPLRQIWNSASPDWTIVSQNQQEVWSVRNTNKGMSIHYPAFGNSQTSAESWLVSPTLDLSFTTEASLFFDVSYASRISGSEELKILASRDCGVTYETLPLYSKTSSELAITAFSSAWAPAMDSDWKREYVNLNEFVGEKELRLAWVVRNGNGNNLFLDNMEFFVNDDTNPLAIDSRYAIYSGANNFRITFNLTDRSDVIRMQIYNLTGQIVSDQQLYNVLNQTFDVDFSPTSSGIYIVKMQIDNTISTQKVFVSR